MTYVFDDVAVVGDEEESAGVGHVDLHADETCIVPWCQRICVVERTRSAREKGGGRMVETYHQYDPANDAV